MPVSGPSCYPLSINMQSLAKHDSGIQSGYGSEVLAHYTGFVFSNSCQHFGEMRHWNDKSFVITIKLKCVRLECLGVFPCMWHQACTVGSMNTTLARRLATSYRDWMAVVMCCCLTLGECKSWVILNLQQQMSQLSSPVIYVFYRLIHPFKLIEMESIGLLADGWLILIVHESTKKNLMLSS